MSATLPRARKAGLVARKLHDEVLVYDLDRHKASCLNRAAALVWDNCNGKTTVADLVAKLQPELGAEVDERAVWLALDRLDEAHLLEGERPAPVGEGSPSRREWLRGLADLGVRVALLPAVVTIVAPTVADAQSVITLAECKGRALGACGNTPCVGGGTCQPAGKGKNQCWCV